MSPLTSLRDWLQARGGGVEAARSVLGKPIPRNIGWVHTLGSLLLVYLIFQALTGALLGLYYSAAPANAYDSVRYVREDLAWGNLLYKLHRAGASFVLATAFLHLARSYFLAAYKKPRELLWLVGVVLFGLLIVSAFTGQLLPWEQRGYWATVIGLELVASAPLVGEGLRDLLTGGYGDIGPVTLGRFFLIHVTLLPIALVMLIGTHLYVLQRVGSAGPPDGDPEPTRSFHPAQTFKDVLVAAAGVALLFLVASLASFPDHGPADPTSPGSEPQPEWFFYAHYQLLRLTPQPLQPLAEFWLPALFFGLLFALPFVDRSAERAPRRRIPWMIGGALVCLLLVGLTARGIVTAPEVQVAEGPGDPVARGKELFHEHECVRCHTIPGVIDGGTEGPRLEMIGVRLRTDFLRAWISSPAQFRPETEMPAFDGPAAELDAIVAFLRSLE